MASCAFHKWILMNAGAKTYVMCQQCSTRFPFTSDLNGAPYTVPVPEKYRA